MTRFLGYGEHANVQKELPQDDRARLLSQLAGKVFSHATGL